MTLSQGGHFWLGAQAGVNLHQAYLRMPVRELWQRRTGRAKHTFLREASNNSVNERALHFAGGTCTVCAPGLVTARIITKLKTKFIFISAKFSCEHIHYVAKKKIWS
jgi:hypothetical protein